MATFPCLTPPIKTGPQLCRKPKHFPTGRKTGTWTPMMIVAVLRVKGPVSFSTPSEADCGPLSTIGLPILTPTILGFSDLHALVAAPTFYTHRAEFNVDRCLALVVSRSPPDKILFSVLALPACVAALVILSSTSLPVLRSSFLQHFLFA